jgi:hypothetical protein
MIPMQVRNKYVLNLAAPDFVLGHLHLGAFTAINQEKVLIQGNHLCRGMPVKCRKGRVVAQNRNSHHSLIVVE